jgi:hypothetical protein
VFLLYKLQPRKFDEQVDWMIYGCLSALGFSLLENYLYLLRHGPQVDTGRFFFSTPLHLSLTGYLAMSLRRLVTSEPRAWAGFLRALAVVAIVHGLYDLLLSNESGWVGLSGVLLGPLWGLYFLRLLSRAASTSPFRATTVAYRISCTSWFMGAFALLCIVNYLATALELGAEEARPRLATELIIAQVYLLLGLIYSRLHFARADRPPELVTNHTS